MATGTWIGRINRSKTCPHPNTAANVSSSLLTERRPDRVETEIPQSGCLSSNACESEAIAIGVTRLHW